METQKHETYSTKFSLDSRTKGTHPINRQTNKHRQKQSRTQHPLTRMEGRINPSYGQYVEENNVDAPGTPGRSQLTTNSEDNIERNIETIIYKNEDPRQNNTVRMKALREEMSEQIKMIKHWDDLISRHYGGELNSMILIRHILQICTVITNRTALTLNEHNEREAAKLTRTLSYVLQSASDLAMLELA